MISYRNHPKHFFRFSRLYKDQSCYATCSLETGVVVELGASKLIGRDLDHVIGWLERACVFRAWLEDKKLKTKVQKSVFPRDLRRSNYLNLADKRIYNTSKQHDIDARFQDGLIDIYGTNLTLHELGLLIAWLRQARLQQRKSKR